MASNKTASSGMQLIWNGSTGRMVRSVYGACSRVLEGSAALNPRIAPLHARAEAAAAVAVSENAEVFSSGRTPLSVGGPYFTQVTSRGVISLDGPDVFKFLQGLITNDVTRLERSPGAALATPSPAVITPPVYTALLNPQGRFLYDLFLYRPTHSEERLDRSGFGPGEGKNVPDLIADVDKDEVDELVSFVKRHRLRAKVNIENLSDDLKVWQRFGGVSTHITEENGSEAGQVGWAAGLDKSAQQTAATDESGWRWYNDPRLMELGFRGVFPDNNIPPLVTSDQTVGDDYYLLWRLEQGIPEGSKEIPKGEAIPLEYNLAGLNAISFEKGCYIGQELIARTHHRGVIRKRLMPVNFVFEDGAEAQQGIAPGVDILDSESNKKVGKVTTVLGPRGLALVRLDAAQRASSKLKLDIPAQNVQVKAIRPKWWPGEWGREDRQSTAAAA